MRTRAFDLLSHAAVGIGSGGASRYTSGACGVSNFMNHASLLVLPYDVDQLDTSRRQLLELAQSMLMAMERTSNVESAKDIIYEATTDSVDAKLYRGYDNEVTQLTQEQQKGFDRDVHKVRENDGVQLGIRF
jgi:uncharacterized protein HemY